MNKSELITTVMEKAGISHKQAEDVVNLIFDSMSKTLQEGGRIEIRGFGSFVVRQYQSYKGRNPRTGERIEVAPKQLPFFKVGKELKDLVDNSNDSSPDETISINDDDE